MRSISFRKKHPISYFILITIYLISTCSFVNAELQNINNNQNSNENTAAVNIDNQDRFNENAINQEVQESSYVPEAEYGEYLSLNISEPFEEAQASTKSEDTNILFPLPTTTLPETPKEHHHRRKIKHVHDHNIKKQKICGCKKGYEPERGTKCKCKKVYEPERSTKCKCKKGYEPERA
ncbi:hypothetical protein BB558_001581 [Smittium angustum]|uniref:Uncharacterized protein n=1 Tax=Smittium angustum TaxID=133377 RepID=A0A2U1JB73_SMIAN|nr:hypothetical protein BB558_001581 [Smittium angustum]